jgi:hypothetical protein
MHSSPRQRITFGLVALLLASVPLLAAEVPLTNWIVPTYHRPASASGGLSTMTDITSGSAFVGMQPCRLVDTRPSQGFAGQWGPPIMAANAIRTFDLNSAPHCTGIPAGVEAYSLNFAVTETVGQPGDIRAWPTGTPPVAVTSVLNWNFVGAAAIANSIIIPAGTNGQIDVQVAGFNTHLVIDINGYFTTSYNDGTAFIAAGNVAAFFLPGFLVAGSNSNNGVFAYGTFGLSSSIGADSAGASGWETGATGKVYGVSGMVSSSSIGAAGVYGANHAAIDTDHRSLAAGVIGTGGAGAGGVVAGVAGYGSDRGVTGYQCTSTTIASCGDGGNVGHSATSGLHSFGDITAGGTKFFVEPHPTDASKEIRYISLEGPEAGTYFRGKARFQNGIAIIEVPEYFRLATDPEGLSIQVTPIGQMATVAVESIGLDRIVVRGSRNVEFFYLVNGVRPDYKDFQPIVENSEFRPQSESDTLPDWKRPQIRRRLVANGTLTPDGKVNMQTAQRLGWDKIWLEREAQVSEANANWKAFEAERMRSNPNQNQNP